MLNKGIKMNITVKNLIKKTIKNTRYYQNKKFREFIQGSIPDFHRMKKQIIEFVIIKMISRSNLLSC